MAKMANEMVAFALLNVRMARNKRTANPRHIMPSGRFTIMVQVMSLTSKRRPETHKTGVISVKNDVMSVLERVSERLATLFLAPPTY